MMLAREKAIGLWASIRDRLKRAGECLVWQGATNGVGYGHFGRSENGLVTTYNVHAVAYVALVGAVPKGMVLDHTCRNRACAEIGHLEPVTVLENSIRGEHPNYRTHRTGVCKRGHRIEGENVRRRRDGRVRCRACAIRKAVARG